MFYKKRLRNYQTNFKQKTKVAPQKLFLTIIYKTFQKYLQ